MSLSRAIESKSFNEIKKYMCDELNIHELFNNACSDDNIDIVKLTSIYLPKKYIFKSIVDCIINDKVEIANWLISEYEFDNILETLIKELDSDANEEIVDFLIDTFTTAEDLLILCYKLNAVNIIETIIETRNININIQDMLLEKYLKESKISDEMIEYLIKDFRNAKKLLFYSYNLDGDTKYKILEQFIYEWEYNITKDIFDFLLKDYITKEELLLISSKLNAYEVVRHLLPRNKFDKKVVIKAYELSTDDKCKKLISSCMS